MYMWEYLLARQPAVLVFLCTQYRVDCAHSEFHPLTVDEREPNWAWEMTHDSDGRYLRYAVR